MFICDHDPIIKALVLYVGSPLNEELEFLLISIDISKSQAEADRP